MIRIEVDGHCQPVGSRDVEGGDKVKHGVHWVVTGVCNTELLLRCVGLYTELLLECVGLYTELLLRCVGVLVCKLGYVRVLVCTLSCYCGVLVYTLSCYWGVLVYTLSCYCGVLGCWFVYWGMLGCWFVHWVVTGVCCNVGMYSKLLLRYLCGLYTEMLLGRYMRNYTAPQRPVPGPLTAPAQSAAGSMPIDSICRNSIPHPHVAPLRQCAELGHATLHAFSAEQWYM